MILYINTASLKDIELGLKSDGVFIAKNKVGAERAQAEKLLPEIEKLLRKNKFKLKDVEEIEVENSGGSFTSLRIGVATANALGFALGVPVTHPGASRHSTRLRDLRPSQEGNLNFDVVEPVYDREAV